MTRLNICKAFSSCCEKIAQGQEQRQRGVQKVVPTDRAMTAENGVSGREVERSARFLVGLEAGFPGESGEREGDQR